MGESETDDNDRLEELDEATLTDHPYEATITVRSLLPDDTNAQGWKDHLEWYAKTKFSELPSVVEVEVSDRALEPDADQ